MTATPQAAFLLDGNVLVALADASHVHHVAARDWFVECTAPFATCPITQGTLLRMLMRGEAVPSVDAAVQVLAGFTAHPRHRFWPDDIPYAEVAWQGVLGHRQVTDAYLAALARRNNGKLLTFDSGLAALHTDIGVLVER